MFWIYREKNVIYRRPSDGATTEVIHSPSNSPLYPDQWKVKVAPEMSLAQWSRGENLEVIDVVSRPLLLQSILMAAFDGMAWVFGRLPRRAQEWMLDRL